MAVKLCPQCGEGNRESALQCIVCGSSLKDASLIGTPDSDKSYMQSSKPSRCSHCGEGLDDDSLKCKYCGTLATRNTSSAQYSYEEEETIPDRTSMTLLVIITLFIPLVGLIVGGTASFSDDGYKRDSGKLLMILGMIMGIVQFILFRIIF